MDPTMGQAPEIGMSGFLDRDDMLSAQSGEHQVSSTETVAVVETAEAEVLPPAEPLAPATNYPAGVVDFNKPFIVFDAYDDSVIHDDARVLTVLTGNAYPVVVLTRHDGEEVIHQFDTDGDDVEGELKAENLESGPRVLYGVLIRQGRRDYGLRDELFASEEAARHETELADDEVIASVFPVTIPGLEGSSAILSGVVEVPGGDNESDHLAVEDEESDEHVEEAAVNDPNARWVNGRMIKPGNKVRARKTGEYVDRVCTVIKTRDDHKRALFIQPDEDGHDPYWALNKKIYPNY